MSEPPIAHPSLVARLAEIRREAARLIGDIDTRVKPKPDAVIPVGEKEKFPGPLWDLRTGTGSQVERRWRIRVIDPDLSDEACVFVSHPHLWEGDILPIHPDDARRIGMTFLAAADWADQVRARGGGDA